MKNADNNIENFEQSNIYKVPNRYFEELPIRIQSKINSNARHKSFISMHIGWVLTVAAMTILFFGSYLYPINTANHAPDQVIERMLIIEYLDGENLSIDEIITDGNFLEDFSINEEIWSDELIDNQTVEFFSLDLDDTFEII